MKYEITYACGHTGIVSLYGPVNERERKLDWYKYVSSCPECYKSKLAKVHEKYREEYELPILVGTEKQIRWAETLRKNLIDRMNQDYFIPKQKAYAQQKDSNTQEQNAKYLADLEDDQEMMRRIMTCAVDARFWIDNRSICRFCQLVDEFKMQYPTVHTDDDVSEEAQAAIEEMTLLPEEQTHEGVVQVTLYPDKVTATYQRDDNFIAVAKKCGYRWKNRLWQREKTACSGEMVDRAADLINALLLDGFAVMCSDDNVRRLAETASFKPECKRWVKYNKNADTFIVCWDRIERDFYDMAKRLPGARWDMEWRGVTVPARNWRDVEDFAQINSFRLTELSQERVKVGKDTLIEITPIRQEKAPEPDKLAKILKNTNSGPLDDLLDA